MNNVFNQKAARLTWNMLGDTSGYWSDFDLCYNVTDCMSDDEHKQFCALPKDQRVELMDHAHETTVRIIDKLLA